MKKLLSLVLVLTLLMSFAVPTFAADAVEITIFHLNDTHSRVEEGDYDGMGLAKVATLVNESRDAGDNVLLLDAGDALHGQTIATISEGESIVDIMNLMGYDAMAAGNHDFNYGSDRLVELAGLTDFPILSANVMKADDTPLLEEYVIKEFDGVKVGIFGLSTPETTYKTHPDNVAGLTFEDPTVTARAMVDLLDPMVDIVVCLGHIGEEGDYTAEGIVNAVDGIDVFVDAHSHTVYESGLVVNDTLIVQAGEYDKNLGVVSLSYENGAVTASASLVTKEEAPDIVPDEAVSA
ncbi:MAG: bifunctional UDP-sugar hydrolase/5'-nucleotidase, partial [Vallitaleaceae bacterium]|nr:bifunctional UDP-sugar hydrolase/5'-nucleotidase [Vallitaleaceae bacterium]